VDWTSTVARAVNPHRRSTNGEYENSIDHPSPVMKKFNNTLAGTDCGNAGLPAHSCDTPKAKTVLHIVPKTPDNAFRARCDRTRQQDREDGGHDGSQ
jgi:hypothetical protein